MRLALFMGWIALLSPAWVLAQTPTVPPVLRAFLNHFQQAISEAGQPKAGAVPAAQYFLSDSSKVADTSYPEETYTILYPETTASTWLKSLQTAFGNVLFFSIDSTQVKMNTIPGKPGQQRILISLLVTLEGLRTATQQRQQLTELQIWQLTEMPKATDKLNLGYRIVSIKSTRQPQKVATLTLDQVEKLQKQLKENLVKLAWAGTTPNQRKTLLDNWHQQEYPDTLHVTQNNQRKKVLLTDWSQLKLTGDALANLAIESMDLRWADAPGKATQQEPIRRVTEWKNMRMTVNDSLVYGNKTIFYEKVDPLAKSTTTPTLTIVHIYVNR